MMYRCILTFLCVASLHFDGCAQSRGTYMLEGTPKELPKTVKETSGLAWAGNNLLTHNDKGGQPILFAIDTASGAVSHRILIAGVENIDWEDLAASDSMLFIGDMGNNRGDRTDLAIHMVSKACASARNDTVCPVLGSIRFRYPEQQDLETRKKHNFDCEAIVHSDGDLLLFTKHRLDGHTVAYRVPAVAGTHDAERIASFDAGGRVTGADLYQGNAGSILRLVGYNKDGDCFLWTFPRFSNSQPFGGEAYRTVIGSFADFGQMEAVVHLSEKRMMISSEKSKQVPARLYLIAEP